MASTHFSVSIVKASQNQSAVAKASYQSAERLYCDKDMTYKNYLYKQSELVYKDILLPPNAPESFHDRATLWNAVEKVEKQCNAQYARNIIIGLPNEIPNDQLILLVKEYCMNEFVSKGMCCDIAIHDKGDGNPHAHILLTMRALDEHGEWMSKSRKIYVLDEDGNKIKLPSGNYKTRKENVTDWDDRDNCEKWRQSWANHANKYLELCGSDIRIDLSSYERQGIDKIPTVHLGSVASEMEREGIPSHLGDLNRDIISFNELMDKVIAIVQSLYDKWIASRTPKPHEESLADYMSRYLEIRADVRSTWSLYAQQKSDFKDLLSLHNTLCYLKSKGIYDINGLNSYLQSCEKNTASTKEKIKSINKRLSKINSVITAKEICRDYESIAKEYDKIFFSKPKEKYRSEHKDELDTYFTKKSYLKKYAGDDAGKKLSELNSEKDKLLKQKADLEASLSSIMTDDEKKLRSMIKTIKTAPNAEKLGKRSIHDRLNDQKRRSELSNNKPTRKNKHERN
ncbi:MAG: MobQ family relaxase [Lachnospiraceae bacterium]|nr:MobQ family relaxase [Lachnospiraceae bacterium]